jgi:serine/threonine protein kinase
MCEEKFDSAFYKGKISKIQTKIHTLAEMLQNEMIDKIDPDNKYHINAVACTAKQDADFDHSVGKCHSMRPDNNTDYGLIIMDNGGINMYKIFENTQKEWTTAAICNLYVDALSLFQAVQLFVQKRFVHNDVKMDNIVYNASKREMKLIDFGMSDTINSIYDGIHHGKYYYDFAYNRPPEYYFFNIGLIYDEVVDGAKFTRLVNSIASVNMISNLKSKPDFIAKSEIDFKKVTDRTEVLDIADILSKTDSYALGVAMQFINNRITDNILLRSLPLTGFEIFIAHLDVLISKLMCMNFRERLHIDSAVNQYVQLLTLLPSIGRIKRK